MIMVLKISLNGSLTNALRAPVNKDHFLVLVFSGPHLAKNGMQLQGTLVFDIHGPNSGHHFFFGHANGVDLLTQQNTIQVLCTKISYNQQKYIQKVGGMQQHLHHPYMVPKERSNKKGGICLMKHFHLHLVAPTVSSSFCTSICLFVLVCVIRYLQSLIKFVGSGEYELFSDVIH